MDYIDKHAVVTGANRGIGKEVAAGLARLGYTVVLACRNVREAEKARDEIADKTGNRNVHAMQLDIASSKSIFSFAARYAHEFSSIQLLVNNAGVSRKSREKTKDGLEINVGTNYFGTYLLTESLLPYFREGEDRRIINVTSSIYRIGQFRISRINRYRWVKAYAVSKYAILLYTLWLSGRRDGGSPMVNAVHPGIVDTSIMYTGRWYDALIKLFLSPFFIDAAQGSTGILEMATMNPAENGMLYEGGKITRICAGRRRERKMRELMAFSRAYLEEKRHSLGEAQ